MRPQRRGSTLHRLFFLFLAALLATATLVVTAVPAGAVTTAIAVNGGSTGRAFDGVGAISGGGGNSRLLIDYPRRAASRRSSTTCSSPATAPPCNC